MESDREERQLEDSGGGPVSVDRDSLASWEAGGSEHYVALRGGLEDRWVEAFVLVRRRSARFSRFHLNRARNRVSFLCRSADDPAAARAVLSDLELLVTLANQRAILSETSDLDETAPGLGPGEAAAGVTPQKMAPEKTAPGESAEKPASGAAVEPLPPPDPVPGPEGSSASLPALAGRVAGVVQYSLEALAPSSAGSETAPLAQILGTAFLVIEDGGSEDEAIAALLPLEDGEPVAESTYHDIGERFGDRVALLARGCQDAQSALRPGGDPRLYSLYFRHSSPAIRRLVCASKLRSARALLCAYRKLDFGARLHFRDENNGTLQYYRALIEAVLEAGQMSHLVNELDGVVLEMELAAGPAAAERQVKRPIDRLTDEVADKVDLRLDD
ncbi:MAG: hypothetical protein ABJC61_03840 [Acidobacteriota bacterium]